MLVVTPQAKATQFYLSSWSFPDQSGQGIYGYVIESNETGSWVIVDGCNYTESDPSPIAWNTSQALRIEVWSSFNKTLTGVGSIIEGNDYLRHNLTITNDIGVTVYTHYNFTLEPMSPIIDHPLYGDSSLYWYVHRVIPDWLPSIGQFTFTITYEIWW